MQDEGQRQVQTVRQGGNLSVYRQFQSTRRTQSRPEADGLLHVGAEVFSVGSCASLDHQAHGADQVADPVHVPAPLGVSHAAQTDGDERLDEPQFACRRPVGPIQRIDS